MDGSGLDRSDRLTCQLLQQVLAARRRRQRAGPGPARGRPQRHPLQALPRHAGGGPVRAKTGSLLGVAALTGFAAGADADAGSLRFSLLANELPTEAVGLALQDKVVDALAAYPEAPPADAIGPR